MSSVSRFRLVSLQIASAGLLAFAALMPAAASAAPAPSTPTGTLTGVVVCGTDEATPAAGAVVAVEGLNLLAHTDASGQFTLTGVPGARVFAVDALGGPEAVTRFNVPVVAGQTLDIGALDIGTCPQPLAPAPVQDSPVRDDGVNAN